MFYSLIFIALFAYGMIAGTTVHVAPRMARLKAAPFIAPKPKVLGAYIEAGPRLAELDVHALSKKVKDPLHQIDYPIKKPKTSSLEVTSESGLIMDSVTGKILFEKNPDLERRIASITKLMSALVFLDNNPGWDKVIEIKEEYKRQGGKIFLFKGEKVTVKDLFYSSLVGSGNSETIALLDSTGLTEGQFVAKMNDKAASLGLKKTRFEDPVGLSGNNISTVSEIAQIAKQALDKKEIAEAVLTKAYKFTTQQGKPKTIATTDRLLASFPIGKIAIQGGKTGYTDLAGYCFTGKFRNESGHEIITVILGAPTLSGRFSETRKAVEWTYTNFDWGD